MNSLLSASLFSSKRCPSVRAGSSLIELLVYLSCGVIICCLIGQVALTITRAARVQTSVVEAWVTVALALDRLHEDLKKAPSDFRQWKVRSAHALIFTLKNRSEHRDYGWYRDKGRLVRVVGTYNKETACWSHRAMSIVLDAAESITFRFDHYNEEQLAGVKVTLTKRIKNHEIKLSSYTCLKNGPLP